MQVQGLKQRHYYGLPCYSRILLVAVRYDHKIFMSSYPAHYFEKEKCRDGLGLGSVL